MKFLISIWLFIFDLYKSRNLLIELTKNDLKKKYLGSYLGLLWAFIQPTVTIFLFWFVFEVGFKSKPAESFPFILWLVSGIIPWFFFNDSLIGSTSSIIENGFLVNKVVFRVSILPLVKICSALVIHIFFICVLVSLFMVYGYSPSIYWIQMVYYLAATVVLVVGISWTTSALAVFLRDVGQAIGIILQFGFWGTPIFWSINILPQRYQYLIKLNPVFYLVNGYRDAFINHKWFWDNPLLSVYFWTVALFLLVCGVYIFKKLRPQFADVL